VLNDDEDDDDDNDNEDRMFIKVLPTKILQKI